MNTSFPALTWAEGMSAGNTSYLAEWSAVAGTSDSFTSLTTTNGTTTASRAAANGTVTGTIVESAYFFNSYSLDATDMLNFIITADGDVTMRDSLFAVAEKDNFTRFSSGLAQQDRNRCCAGGRCRGGAGRAGDRHSAGAVRLCAGP